jgi:putative ABC transport system permease protein
VPLGRGGAFRWRSGPAARRDELPVTKETIGDNSLRPGDLVRLRARDHATGRFVVVPFHVAGVVQEFPSAPKDSFMVANLAYLDAVTHGAGPNVVLARASGDAAAAGRRVAAAIAGSGAGVRTIAEQTQQTTSSITTVDVTAISRIEEAFAVTLAVAIGLCVQIAVTERRREFATMAALGVPLRQVTAFPCSEAALILVVGAPLATGRGLLLAAMLTAMPTHVFDPPPDHLTIPWSYLAALGASASGAGLAATLIAARSVRGLALGAILRERPTTRTCAGMGLASAARCG